MPKPPMPQAQWSITNSLSSSAPGTGTEGPFLIPADIQQKRNLPISFWIYGPFAAGDRASASQPGTSISTTGGVVSSSPSQTVFTLSPEFTRDIQNLGALQVNVDEKKAWSEDAGDRSAMAAAFKAFRSEIETLESEAKLAMGSSELIANRMAVALPLRLDEILFYAYGFDQFKQTVDICPGMALEIDWSGYQYCDGPAVGVGVSHNSFVTSGQSIVHVTRRSDGTLALNAFSSQFSHGVTIQPPTSGPILAGGPVDLQLLGNGRRHLRLIWPTTFSAPGEINNSGTGNQLSVMLIGASNYADLETATDQALVGGNPCGSQRDGAEPIVCITFSSRVTITPQIWIWINGSAQLVPLGTTVRNIMQRYADPTPEQLVSPASPNDTPPPLSISRWGQQNVNIRQPDATNFYGQFPIILQSDHGQRGPLGDGFDLPLIKGDSLSINPPNPTS